MTKNSDFKSIKIKIKDSPFGIAYSKKSKSSLTDEESKQIKSFFDDCYLSLKKRTISLSGIKDFNIEDCGVSKGRKGKLIEAYIDLEATNNTNETAKKTRYWIQIEKGLVSRGFHFPVEGGLRFKKRTLQRKKWLLNYWNEFIKNKKCQAVIDAINSVKASTKVDLNSYGQNGKWPCAYVYEDFIMPNVKIRIPEDIIVDQLIREIAEELIMIVKKLQSIENKEASSNHNEIHIKIININLKICL